MAELARVTRPGGLAIVSVPGDWRRADTVPLVAERHNGHHRDYGRDVADALGGAFDRVDVVVLGELETGPGLPGHPGLRPDDRLFVCRP
jgi:hypothetical protein